MPLSAHRSAHSGHRVLPIPGQVTCGQRRSSSSNIEKSWGGVRSLAWLILSSDEISIWGHFESVFHVGDGVPKCTPDVLSASHAVLASLNLVAELDGARRPGLVVISKALGKEDPLGATQTDFVGDMLTCVTILSCGVAVLPHTPLFLSEVWSDTLGLSRKLRGSPRV